MFVLSLVVWAGFNPANPGFQLVEKHDWLGGGISYHMGVDGISMLFVVLTAGLMPFCIAASWESVETRVAEYMIAFLVLETMMIGVFCALDLVLFYVLFEGGLIPMFLIIGIWGGKRRVYASFKFFLYTFIGSVLMLLAIMSMYWYSGTTDIVTLSEQSCISPSRCRPGCGWPSSPASRSRCRCGRSIPGCRMRMSRRPRPAPSSWPASC